MRARARAQLRRKQFEGERRKARDELLRSEIAKVEERAAHAIVEIKAATDEEIERKNKELDALSYSISHDLRAPLRAIDGFSRALLEDCADTLDDTGKAHLHSVVAAATRMADLINDLLALSRVSRIGLIRDDVDLSDIAHAIAEDLQQKDPNRKAEFKIANGVRLNADRRLIRMVLENLIGNAWKFTSKIPEAKIEIGSQESRGSTEYFVRDNGAGFEMTYAAKLFSPFQRLHREDEFPGTGIGLAMVSRIADRHGGKAWAESAIDHGTTIFFTIPADRQSPERELRS